MLGTTLEGVEVESYVKLGMSLSESSSSFAPFGIGSVWTSEWVLLLARAASDGLGSKSILSQGLFDRDIVGLKLY